MKPAFFLLLSSASASSLNPERKKGKIQYLSELLLDQIRAENIDDYITEEKIENTVAKLVSGLDTVNYSACSSEFDTEVLNGEFEYTAPEDKTVLCDLAERVPMKVRSWVRHFGCREAFEKKYFKKMRKQAARLKNLAEGVGRCNCIDPCLSLDAGSCWTIMDSCEESLYSPLNWERLTIEPVLKINLEFECQDPLGFALDGTLFKATTRKQLEKRLLLEVEYQTRDGETKVHVTNENFNYSFTCSPGDWHCIELEHMFVLLLLFLFISFKRKNRLAR